MRDDVKKNSPTDKMTGEQQNTKEEEKEYKAEKKKGRRWGSRRRIRFVYSLC